MAAWWNFPSAELELMMVKASENDQTTHSCCDKHPGQCSSTSHRRIATAPSAGVQRSAEVQLGVLTPVTPSDRLQAASARSGEALIQNPESANLVGPTLKV